MRKATREELKKAMTTLLDEFERNVLKDDSVSKSMHFLALARYITDITTGVYAINGISEYIDLKDFEEIIGEIYIDGCHRLMKNEMWKTELFNMDNAIGSLLMSGLFIKHLCENMKDVSEEETNALFSKIQDESRAVCDMISQLQRIKDVLHTDGNSRPQ